MIYFYEFLKGVGFALSIFGAWYFFALSHSPLYALVGGLPGLLLFMISFLLIENDELRKGLESGDSDKVG